MSTPPPTETKDDNIETITVRSDHADDKENVVLGDNTADENDADMNLSSSHIEQELQQLQQQQLQMQRREDRGEEEYERAVRRALTENEYVKQINSQLIAKLNAVTSENEASKGSIHKLTNVCQGMKELIVQLANAKDSSDSKVRELEKISRRKDGKVVTLAKLEALEIGQRSMDEMVSALQKSLDVACRERDEALSSAAEEAKEHNSIADELERKLALVTKERENWEEKYHESSKMLAEVTEERDTLKVKWDEGVETVFISKKNEEDWEMKCSELDEELKQVASERNSLRKDMDSKCEDWDTKYGELTTQLQQMTAERNSLSEEIESKCGELAEQLRQVTSERNTLSEEMRNKSKSWEAKHGELAEQLKELTLERNALSEALDNNMQAYSAEKKELEETIDLLARDSDEWQDKYNKSGDELVKITDACDGLQIALQDARESMNDSKRMCEELSAEKASLQKEIIDLTNKVDEESSAKSSLQLEVDSLHSKIEEINADNSAVVGNLRLDLESASTSLIEASTARDATSAENGSLRQDIELLEKERDDWQSKYNESANDLVNIATARGGLELELQGVRKSMNDSKRMCEELTSERASLQMEIVNLTNKVDEQSSAMNTLKLEVDSLHSKIEEITAANAVEVGNLRQELESASASLVEASSARDTKTAENGSLRQDIELLEKERGDWQHKYNETANELVNIATARDSLESELQIVRNSVNDSKRKCEELTSEKASLQKEIEDLTNKVDEQSSVNSALRVQVEEITAAKELEVDNLRCELETASASLVEASTARDTMSAELGPLKQELAFFAKDSVHWHEKFVKCANDLAELKSKGSGLETELQGVRETVTDSSRLCEDLTAEKASMQKEIADLTTKIDEHSATNSSLQQEIDYLQYKVEAIKLAKEREVGNLRQELESVSSSLIGASSEKDNLLAETNSLRERILTLEADITSSSQITRRLECADAKNESLASEMNYVKSENSSLQQQIQNLQVYVSEITACHDDSIEVISPTHMQQAENEYLSREREELATKNDALQQNYDILQSKLTEITAAKESAAEAFQITVDGLRAQLAERERMGEEMTQQLNDTKIGASREQEQLQSKISLLKADLYQSSQEADRLRSEMELLERSQAESHARAEHDKVDYEEQIKSLNLTLDSVKEKVISLEVDLIESKQEEERLRGAMTLMESSHADALAQLEAEKAASLGQLKSLSIAIDSEKEITSREQEQLRSKISSLEVDLLQSSQEVDRLRSEMELLERSQAESRARAEHDKVDYEEQIKSLTLTLDSVKEKVTSLEADLLKSKQEEDRLRGAVTLMESSHTDALAQLEAEKAASLGKVKSLNIAIDSEKEITSREQEQLRSKISSLEVDLLHSSQEVDRLRAEMEISSRELEQLQLKISLLEADLLHSKREEDMLRSDMALLESKHAVSLSYMEHDKANFQETLKSLKLTNDADMERAVREENQLKSKIETIEAELFASKTEADRLRVAMTLLERSHLKALARLEDEKVDLQSNVKSSSLSLDVLKEETTREAEHLKSKIASLEDELYRSTEEAKSLRFAMEMLESSHTANVTNLLSRLEERKDQKLAQGQAMNRRIEELTTDVENAIKKLADAHVVFEDQKADLLKALDEKSLIINKLEDKIQELDESKNDACWDKEQLSSRIASLEADLVQSMQDEESVRNAMKSLENSDADMRARFEDEINDFQARIASLTEKSASEKMNLEEKVQALETKTKTLVEKGNEQHEEMNNAIQKAKTTQLFLDASNEINASLMDKCNALETDAQKHLEQIEKLTSSINEIESSLAVMKEENESLRNDISEAKRERDQAMTKVEGLSKELNLTAIALSEVQELISKDQIQAAETQQQLKSLEAEKKMLEESITSIRSDKENINQQLEFSRQEAEDFRRKLESSKTLAESMTNRCELVESEVQTSKQAVLDLKDKLETSESLAKTLEDKCDQLRSTIAELTAKSNEADALVKVLQLENHRNIARCRQQDERSNSEIVCLENIIKSLKTEYEAFKVEAKAAATAQLKSCEAKLESLYSVDGNRSPRAQDRTFDDMITILRKDRFLLIEKSRSTAKQLETAQKEISALEHAVASLRKEFETFRVETEVAATSQIRLFKAKLEPLCSFREGCSPKMHEKTFEDMIEMIQNELSSVANELELAKDEKLVLDEQVCILSTEVSKFKLQNKGLLKALDDITKNL